MFDMGRWDPAGPLTPAQFPLPACTAPDMRPVLRVDFKGNGALDGEWAAGVGAACVPGAGPGCGGGVPNARPVGCQRRGAQATWLLPAPPALRSPLVPPAWALDASKLELQLSYLAPDETSMWDERTGVLLTRVETRRFRPCTNPGTVTFPRSATTLTREFTLCAAAPAQAALQPAAAAVALFQHLP